MSEAEGSLNKIVLTMSITMILLSTMAISALDKNSAEYVIAVISIVINIILISCILIRVKIKK